MRKDQLLAIHNKVSDLIDLHKWLGDELNNLVTLLPEKPVVKARKRVRRAPAEKVFEPNLNPPQKSNKYEHKKSYSLTLTGPAQGPEATEIRNKILQEISEVIKLNPGKAFRTSELYPFSPTAKWRYSTDKRAIAGVNAILREIGSTCGIKNVSNDAWARWMYIAEKK